MVPEGGLQVVHGLLLVDGLGDDQRLLEHGLTPHQPTSEHLQT